MHIATYRLFVSFRQNNQCPQKVSSSHYTNPALSSNVSPFLGAVKAPRILLTAIAGNAHGDGSVVALLRGKSVGGFGLQRRAVRGVASELDQDRRKAPFKSFSVARSRQRGEKDAIAQKDRRRWYEVLNDKWCLRAKMN